MRNLDNQNRHLPASVIQAAMIDPAAGTGAPPNFGREIVPHIHTTAGRFGVASHSYLNMDEALQDSRANAQRMRQDCGIMECVEGRQRAVAMLPWHIACEDEKSPLQKELATRLKAIIEKTPRFTEYRRVLQEAIWYGKYAIANQFAAKQVKSQWSTCVGYWEPREGDKLIFRYDDGTGKYQGGQVGIRVSTAFRAAMRGQDGRSKVQPTESGLVYWLDNYERQTMVVHKHQVEDGPWDQPRMAGRIHGVGIRDRIYWTWYAMTECLQRVVEYLDRAAFGMEIWPYAAGNPEAKLRVEEAAKNAMGGGRTVILAPIPPGEDGDRFRPELIEPGLGGVATTIEIIRTYFGHRIKRYILGQTLSSEADATGMGSGVADAHLATLADILSYDAVNLEETLTCDLLRPLQLWNDPKSANVDLRFVIDTESDNVKEKLEAISTAWAMGLKIKSDELYQIVGTARPDADDEILANPKIHQPIALPPGSQGGGVFSPESFLENVQKAVAQKGLVA